MHATHGRLPVSASACFPVYAARSGKQEVASTAARDCCTVLAVPINCIKGIKSLVRNLKRMTPNSIRDGLSLDSHTKVGRFPTPAKRTT